MSNEQRKRRGLYLNFALCSLLFAICYLSCSRIAINASRPPSPTVEVGQSDKEIEKITDNARRSLPIFFRNLNRPENGANNFYVKYPLSSDDGGVEPKVREQVWLGSIRLKNDAYYGTPANTPRSHGRKMKRVNIDTDKITDWMYIQDGKIIGGRSIKYLLEKIPEDQRGEDQRRILRMFE
jgi:uncharacterized protein YegJ (DUF2314 family)